jgi:hypothetical protein
MASHCRLSTGRKPATTIFGTFLSIHTDENGLIEKAGQSTPSLISCALFMNGVTRFLRARSRFDHLPPDEGSSVARGLIFPRPYSARAVAPTLLQPWPGGLTPGSSIQRFRRPFPGSSSTRSGGIAARAVSMSAMATASMTPNDAPTWIAGSGSCVTELRCAWLAKTKQDPHDHALAHMSRSSATGSIDNSPGGLVLH